MMKKASNQASWIKSYLKDECLQYMVLEEDEEVEI